MKNDIKLNYGTLDAMLDKISNYISDCSDMASSVRAIDRLIEESSGDAVDALRESKQATLEAIEHYSELLKNLFSLIDGFISDMITEIQPIYRAGMTRVDCADIASNINTLYLQSRIIRDPSASMGMTIDGIPLDATIIERSRRLNDEIGSIQRHIDGAITSMWDVQAMANRYSTTDNEYTSKAYVLYMSFTTEQQRQMDIYLMQGEQIWDYLRGCWDSIVNMFKGIGGLVEMWRNSIYYQESIEAGSTPRELQEYMESQTSGITRVLGDWRLLFEDPAKQFADDWDESPLYALGTITPDIVLTILTLREFAIKVKNLVKVKGRILVFEGAEAEGVGLLDDVASHTDDAKGVGLLDDLEHADDAKGIGTGIKATEDARRIPDIYRNLDFNITNEEFLNKFVDPRYHDGIRKAFGDNWESARVTKLAEDLVVYRYYGGSAGPDGYYFTTSLVDDPISQLALVDNTAEYIVEVIIPKGSVVVEGGISGIEDLPGGGYQIYSPIKLGP